MDPDITRRVFLGTASASVAAAAMGRLAAGAPIAGGAPGDTGVRFSKTRILRMYLAGRPSWPRPDLDLQAERDRIQAEFDKTPGLDDIEFVHNQIVSNPGELMRLFEQHKDIAGVLAVPLCLGIGAHMAVLAEANRPTMVLAIPYSGHEWCLVPEWQRQGKKIDVIPTSDLGQIATAVRPLRAISRLRQTKVLFVSGGWVPAEAFLNQVRARLGVEIIPTDPQAILDAYESIDETAVKTEAERWTRTAEAIKEPPSEEIAKSARMTLGLHKLLIERQAQAITINCLGLFGQGKLPAYPCLAFSRLNDIGLTGVCEADLACTLTQVIYQHMENVPGFVTDPVFDVPRNEVIHAHCVSATKMDGPAGPAAPYIIRSHLEDNKGASLQVKMRKGQEITMAKLVGADPRAEKKIYLAATPAESLGAATMLLSTGTITDVPTEDRGCRTKVTTRVRDARKMLDGWAHGLHRVIFYGNHVEDTHRLARFLEFDVVEEG